MAQNVTFLPDPIPGGCNIEFPLEVDPNLRLYYTPEQTVAQFEYSSYDSQRSSSSFGCESVQEQGDLHYDV